MHWRPSEGEDPARRHLRLRRHQRMSERPVGDPVCATPGGHGSDYATARKLAGLFSNNFKTYEAGASAEIKAAVFGMKVT